MGLALEADEVIRQSWQGQVLAHSSGRMMVAITSMLAHSFDDDLPFILNAVRPKCWDANNRSLIPPFLFTIGRVNYQGNIDAGVINRYGAIERLIIFASVRDFEYELRKHADRCRLSDEERVEFFKMAQAWCPADQRLDPSMDPRDPDARRITH